MGMARAMGNSLGWLISFLVITAILVGAAKLAIAVYEMRLRGRIAQRDVREIRLHAVDEQVVDRRVGDALLGALIAGDIGAAIGYAGGRRTTHISSVTFWLRYADGTKEEIRARYGKGLYRDLIRRMEQLEFQNW